MGDGPVYVSSHQDPGKQVPETWREEGARGRGEREEGEEKREEKLDTSALVFPSLASAYPLGQDL